MEVEYVILICAGVGWVGEYEEIVALGLECLWISCRYYWMVVLVCSRGVAMAICFTFQDVSRTPPLLNMHSLWSDPSKIALRQ